MNNEKLDDIICKKLNPFNVPEGYFEQLTETIMNKIPEKQSSETPVLHVTTWQRVKPWIYMAAMFCIIMLSARYMLTNSSQTQIASQSTAAINSSATDDSYTEEYIEETIMNMQADDYTVYCYLTNNDSES